MKTIILLMTVLSLNAFTNSSECVDKSTAFFEACEEGEKRFFVQGICTELNEIESTYCADKMAPECIDVAVTLFSPCEEDEKRIYVQGRCTEENTIEHSYCGRR